MMIGELGDFHNISDHNRDNDPPYSRLFIVCGKDLTEEELSLVFSPYGSVQSCKLVRQKTGTEGKGIAYIKFDKASSAALAIEGLNGHSVTDDSSPLKVMIADAKGAKSSRNASKEPEDTPPRSRLFVICSKDTTEESLIRLFKTYGDLEYCKVIRDKVTNESKGFAYVKYTKSSSAAIAMEEINKQQEDQGSRMKVLISDPKKGTKVDSVPALPTHLSQLPTYPSMGGFPYSTDLMPASPYGMSALSGMGALPYGVSRQRLFVVCHKTITQDQLARLFSRYPGMEYCDVKKNKHTGESKGFAYVNYSTPQAALMAKEQLEGFEFPPGTFLKVMFAEPLGVKKTISSIRDSFAQMMSGANLSYPVAYPQSQSMGLPPQPQQQQQQQQPPQQQHKTSVRNSSAMSSGSVSPTSMTSSTEKVNKDRNIYPDGSRLYIVLSKPLPQYVLQDTFSRFGGLEYVHLQSGKSFGFAKYTTAATAQCAMTYLNDSELHGQKLRIQIAQPPSESRKRQKI